MTNRDEITSLREKILALRVALTPFAEITHFIKEYRDDDIIFNEKLQARDFRHASALIAATAPPTETPPPMTLLDILAPLPQFRSRRLAQDFLDELRGRGYSLSIAITEPGGAGLPPAPQGHIGVVNDPEAREGKQPFESLYTTTRFQPSLREPPK